MNDTVSILPAVDSASGNLLHLVAVSGEFPVAQAGRVISSLSYLEKTVTKFKSNKLIRTYYRDDLRGYRLTALAKKCLIREKPDWFSPLFVGKNYINSPKYSAADRRRLHRMAESAVSIMNAGIVLYPWEKPELFQSGHISSSFSYDRPVYYTAMEIKEIGQEAAKIRGARAVGVLLTEDMDYLIYNTANLENDWAYRSEVRLKALIQREAGIARQRLSLPTPETNAILFASDMEQMKVMMDVLKQVKHQYFILDGVFRHFYYLTNDRYGEMLLRLLCDSESRATLNTILSEDLKPCRAGVSVEHDGYDVHGLPVLFGYTCDMPRIKRFDNALSLREQNGVLICFDYQEETLRQICSPYVKLQSIDFEAVQTLLYGQN